MNRTHTSPPGSAANLDLRDLPPPEPLQRALEAAEALVPGTSVTVLTRFRPAFLLDELAARGLSSWCTSMGDEGWQTAIKRETASQASTPLRS